MGIMNSFSRPNGEYSHPKYAPVKDVNQYILNFIDIKNNKYQKPLVNNHGIKKHISNFQFRKGLK